jgi:hypothetical protein
MKAVIPMIRIKKGNRLPPIPLNSLKNMSVKIIGRVPISSTALYFPLNSPIMIEFAISPEHTAMLVIVYFNLSSGS